MLNTLIKMTNSTIKVMENIVGKDNVLSDYEELLAYSTDSTNITNPNEIAEVVVFVENVQQVSKIMKKQLHLWKNIIILDIIKIQLDFLHKVNYHY